MLLETVRSEIAEREQVAARVAAQLESLRRIEGLVVDFESVDLDGLDPRVAIEAVLAAVPEPVVAPPAEPKKPKRARPSAPAGANLEDRVRRAKNFMEREGRPVTPGLIRQELGFAAGGGETAKKLLRALAADEDVVVEGATRNRTYRLRTPGRQQPTLEGRLVAALQTPRPVAALPTLVEAPVDDILRELRRLKEEGDVEELENHTWRAT